MRVESSREQEEFVGLKYLYRAGASGDAPLFVFIHGRAGTVSVMWAFERCVPEGAAIVSFEAYLPDVVGGMSWWEMSEGLATPHQSIHSAVSRVAYALDQFVVLESLQPKRIVFVGFSQGAALISSGMLCGELRGAGFALLCGLVPRHMLSQGAAGIAGNPAIFIAHGTKDTVIPIERAAQARDALLAMGLTVEYVEDDVEHRLGIQGTRALKGWCGTFMN